jgi:O-antigen/teichoic acid export membrane protein
MSLGKSIRAGVAWLAFGNAGSRVFDFVFGIALARLLFPADFGMIATVGILTGIVSLVTTGGMSQSLIRAKQADEGDFDVVFTLQLGIGALVCAGLFLIAPWFARFFNDPTYVGLLSVSALNFLLRPFALTRSAWLTREMNFKMAAFANLVTTVVTGLSSVAMALAGLGVWSLVFSGLVAALSSNFMLYWLTPLRLHLRVDRHIVRKHSGFGLRLTAIDLLSHFGREAIKVIMSKFAGPAFLGLFTKGQSLSRMPISFIHPATNSVVFRALSKVVDDADQSKYIMHRTITLLCVYTFPLLIGLIWVAEPFIVVLYGEKWLPAAEPARILAISGFFFAIGRPCSALLHAQNRLNKELLIQGAMLVAAIPACFLGLQWGLAGVAWAITLVQIAGVVGFYIAAYQTIPMRSSDLAKALLPPLYLNGLLVVALAAANGVLEQVGSGSSISYFLVMTLVGAAVYCFSFFLLPVQALETERARWKSLILAALRRVGVRAQ